MNEWMGWYRSNGFYFCPNFATATGQTKQTFLHTSTSGSLGDGRTTMKFMNQELGGSSSGNFTVRAWKGTLVYALFMVVFNSSPPLATFASWYVPGGW